MQTTHILTKDVPFAHFMPLLILLILYKEKNLRLWLVSAGWTVFNFLVDTFFYKKNLLIKIWTRTEISLLLFLFEFLWISLYHIELQIALYPKPLCRTLIDGVWHQQQQPKSKIVPRLKWLSAEICVLPSMVAPQSKHQRNNWETKGIHSNPKFVLRSSSRTQNVAAASTAANFEFMILDMHTAHCSQLQA